VWVFRGGYLLVGVRSFLLLMKAFEKVKRIVNNIVNLAAHDAQRVSYASAGSGLAWPGLALLYEYGLLPQPGSVSCSRLPL